MDIVAKFLKLKRTTKIAIVLGVCVIVLVIVQVTGVLDKYKTGATISFTNTAAQGDTAAIVSDSVQDSLADHVVEDLVEEIPSAKIAVDKAGIEVLLQSFLTSSFIITMIYEEAIEEAGEKALSKAATKLTKDPASYKKNSAVIQNLGKLTYRLTKTAGTVAMKASTLLYSQSARAGANVAAKAAAKKASAMIAKLLVKKLTTKMMMKASMWLMGAALGPIGWALQAIGIIGMLVDFWDPNNETSRLDFLDFNKQADYYEARSAFLERLNGRNWPPIVSIQKIFPEEFEQSEMEVFNVFAVKCIEYIMDFPEEDPGLAALIMQLNYDIPQKVFEDEVLKKLDDEIANTSLDYQQERFAALIYKTMVDVPAMRELLMYQCMKKHITENGNRDFENAKNAPFWYFALSIPTAFYTGVLNVDDIPAAQRGITYNNLTIYDIKITEQKTEFGKTFIDIYRAKSPYYEERVRAYLVPEDSIQEDIGDALIPEMPDIEDIAANKTAEYEMPKSQKGIEDNMIVQAAQKKGGPPMKKINHRFGFRDQPASNTRGRARNNAHSRWLSMCCFQQFLLELAQHPGVAVDLGPQAYAFNEGYSITRLRGIFKWKGNYYRAFAPRPWHEPRFLGFDISEAGDRIAGAIHLTEPFVYRWNEVYEHQRVAGTTLADFRGIPADAVPYAPVAVWSNSYPDVVISQSELASDSGPVPPSTRLITNTNDGFNKVEHRNGRVVFHKKVDSRIAKVVRKSDFDQLNTRAGESALDGWKEIFETDIQSLDLESFSGSLKFDVLYLVKIDNVDYVLCNGNGSGINPWLAKKTPIFPKSSSVVKWPIGDLQNQVFQYQLKNRFQVNTTQQDIVFDIEVETTGLFDQVWTHCIGQPNPLYYKEEIPMLTNKENRILAVKIYKIKAYNPETNEEDLVYFVNHDGELNPNWEPKQTRKTMATERAMFLPIGRLYQACTKGMENDLSMFYWDTTEAERSARRGIYENYIVINSSGVPHTEATKDENGRSLGELISFADYYDQLKYDSNDIMRGFKTFDFQTQRCYIKNKEKHNKFCHSYKGGEDDASLSGSDPYRSKYPQEKSDPRGGMMYMRRCKLPFSASMWTFLLGESIVKMIGRDTPV